MFTSLAAGVLARYEPSSGLIYLLADNRLRTLGPGAKSYETARALLPQNAWPHEFPSVPLNVQIQITKGCNYECGFCYASAQKGRSGLDMPFDKLGELIRKCFRWGVANIQYVGGEPFFRKDFDRIVEHAARLGVAQSIISNGLIPGTRFDRWELTLRTFSKIQLSMNGVGEVYDRSVGGATFARFLGAASRICAANSNTWLSCVLTDETVPQIDSVLTTARRLGARGVRFGVLARVGRAAASDYSYFQSVLPRAEDLLEASVGKYPDVAIESHFSTRWSRLLKDDHKATPLKFRNEGQSVLFVSKDGGLYPFPLLELPEFRLGNAFEDDLSEVWRHHPALAEVRKSSNLAPDCRDCPTPCALSSRSVSLLWTGKLAEKVPCGRFRYEH